MGTSTPFKGGKNGNPLLPDWLDEPNRPPPPLPPVPPVEPEQLDDDAAPPEAPPPDAAEEQQVSNYSVGRTNFTKYARSEGDDRRALGRAVRGYTRKAAGGPATAARRMGSERATAGNLARVLGAALGPGGIREFLATIEFAALATRPIEEIYAALVDYVCPPDGSMEDAYAREAYLEAVVDMTGRDVDLEHPTDETIRDFMASFISNAVRMRIINAIANGVVAMPRDLATATALDAGLMDFITGHVNDALADLQGAIQADAFRAEIDGIFDNVVQLIDGAADEASEARA